LGSKLLVQLKMSISGKKLYSFFNKKWFFDKIYNEYVGQFFFTISYIVTYKTIDRGIIEIFGPMGLSSISQKKAFGISRLQTGYLYHYTFLMLIGFTLLLGTRQLWIFLGDFVDFKIFMLFFALSFFLLNEKTLKNIYRINGNSKLKIKSYLQICNSLAFFN
jgi:hypothetical protein